MKTCFKTLLCLILVVVLCASLFGMSAFAVGDIFILSTADSLNGMIAYTFYLNIADANLQSAVGSMAPGLIYEYNNSYILISGTPTTPGTYTLSGSASTLDGGFEDYSFTLVVENAQNGGTVAPGVSPDPALLPHITKDPTDEEVYADGSAMFIARAENAEYTEWYLIEPETESVFTLDQARSYMKGLGYRGQGSDTLELYSIPLEMDGWKVECLFANMYGDVLTQQATLKVSEMNLVAPSINTQPQSAEKDMDSAVILSVVANNNSPGSTLKYQWYMSSTGGSNLNPISGANSSSYTPPKTRGTVYYTVAVWSSIEDRDSTKTYSSPAAVTYADAPAATATPAPTASPVPTPTTVVSSPIVTEKNDKGGGGGLIILIVALILAAALATVILLILRKNAKTGGAPLPEIPLFTKAAAEKPTAQPTAVPEKAPAPNKNWLCSCGALNNSAFCTQCGKAKPVAKPCSKCGWMPENPNRVPHFCPECGTEFTEE